MVEVEEDLDELDYFKAPNLLNLGICCFSVFIPLYFGLLVKDGHL